MALDTRGIVDGAVRGFGLMDAYYNRQAQNDRAERGLEMREESFDMQKEQAGRQRTKEQATFVLGKIAQGVEPSQEEYQFLKENPQFWPALDPETDKSIEVAQSVIDPESPAGPSDPEAIGAMNQLWGHRINRGDGGRKRVAGLYPGAKPGTVAIDLEVEGGDGTKYNAPMTRNRGTEGDDEVLQTPVEELVNQVQGYRLLRNAFKTPEAQQTASRVLGALTGKRPEQQEAWSEPFEYQGGRYQRSELTGELREVQSPDDVRATSDEGADLSPRQEVYTKRLQSEVDHLWRMERQIQTGQSDGMSIILGGMEETVTPENKDALLSDIRRRIQTNEQELNKMLGVSQPQQGYDALIQEAEKIPPGQRAQELEELKSNPRVPYMVIRQIEEMWGMNGGNPQPDPAPQPQATPEPSAQTQPGLQQPQPQREPEASPGLQTATQPPSERAQQEPAGLQPSQSGRPVLEQQLGPMIESGVRTAGEAIDRRADKNINANARELSQIARGEREPHQGNIRQFLMNNPEAVKRLSPADLQRLQQRYGERFINQFLQQ